MERVTQDIGRRPKRLDEVKILLTLELQPEHLYTQIGVYSAKSDGHVGGGREAKYKPHIEVPMQNPPDLIFNRPRQPPTTEHMGAELAAIWKVHNARLQRKEEKMLPLPSWKVQIAKWWYGEATGAVRGSEV